ncbi:RNA recognition motif domain-containing protein [Ditylenchus destructor]|nr:RNA recognition motif domain-containing protein [Ditylenchus destructor]
MSTTNTDVIRLKDIPYGFFEKELYGYFRQFGTVKRVRVVRSKKGNPTGIAYVKFTKVGVAEVAAETMDNYLLAEKRLQCKVVEAHKVPKCVQSGSLYVPIVNVREEKFKKARKGLAQKSEAQDKKIRIRLLKQMKARMEKLKAMGIDYEFDYQSKYKACAESLKESRALKTEEKKEEVDSPDSDYNSDES